MKRIKALSVAPGGLADYLRSEKDAANWSGFRSHRAGQSYRELRDCLFSLQHGLCCYCEIALLESDCQLEHVVAQSDSHRGRTMALDISNLAACCKGGSSPMFEMDGSADDDRYVKPVARNLSCGQAKADIADPSFIDPRCLPDLEPLFRVHRDGRIKPDPDSCRFAGIPIAHVERTIVILGLNVPRLCRARRRTWAKLSRDWAATLGDSGTATVAARQVLLPTADGRLAAFFTTSRTWFGSAGEQVLAEHHEWI